MQPLGHDKFNDLLRIYGHRIRVIVSTFPHHSDDLLDIEQEILIRLWRHVDRQKELPCAHSWLKMVARSVVVDHNRRRFQTHPGQSPDAMNRVQSDELSPMEIMERGEKVQRVRDELFRLPKRYREAVARKYFEDQGQDEIAQAMDCTEAAVNGLLTRALRRLGMRLSDLANSDNDDGD